MKYRRVAIIGGSGFVGRYVVRRLARQGAVITVLARHATDAGFLRPMGDVGQVALIDTDLSDERALASVLRGVDSVVISAGILVERGTQRFEALHHQGPAHVASLCAAEGVRHLVHISALGADLNSGSSYARSKAAGEAALRSLFPRATILRPSVVFGPEDQFFNRFAFLARLLPALPLIGGGHTKFQPVYVGDVADAVLAALSDHRAAGKTYELGGPRVLSFRQIMELLLAEIARKRILLPVPFGLARMQAAFLEVLPNPPLTRDQVRLLQSDNVLSKEALSLADLNITPTALELILPDYLGRFRVGGKLTARTFA